MRWNELDYEMQMRILDRIGDLILGEKDEVMQFGIAAAIGELEIWSNSPINGRKAEPAKAVLIMPPPPTPEFLSVLKELGYPEQAITNLVNEYVASASDDFTKDDDD